MEEKDSGYFYLGKTKLYPQNLQEYKALTDSFRKQTVKLNNRIDKLEKALKEVISSCHDQYFIDLAKTALEKATLEEYEQYETSTRSSF